MDLSLLPEAPVKPTGETLRPLLTGQAHVDIYTAFGLLDGHEARVKAYGHAERAARLQAEGADVPAVFKALARAEGAAPDDTRPWHAARVDAYATEHGIKGWHRHTDSLGHPQLRPGGRRQGAYPHPHRRPRSRRPHRGRQGRRDHAPARSKHADGYSPPSRLHPGAARPAGAQWRRRRIHDGAD
jgi:hypothetical protein